ncbi:MAG: metallophosphoesterase [Alphaproteobacteria bacterium]|nr:metallophosphoesterase [Alphaproteobacteria bacterium]
MKKYDIIGDIHGHAVELKALLEKLGYVRDGNGVYIPPEPNRMAVFTGDYIDRGGENFEVIDIVRGMVQAGHAHAIMGNHELNASLFHTQHPNKSGELRPLRGHGTRNVHQHQAFLDEATQNPERAAQNIE